jgi:hypothetical protein
VWRRRKKKRKGKNWILVDCFEVWSINVFITYSQQKVTGPPKYLLICSHCELHTMKDYKNTCNSTIKTFSHLCFHFYSAISGSR